MSRFRQLAIGFCLVSAAMQTVVFARGFAGVPAQDLQGVPARGFLGFPAGGVGGFAGGHTYGMHDAGMPGRHEFDTLYPVTLPNLRADGRLHPYGMPPMSVYGDFHPGGLPGMGGYAGLHPVRMPDMFATDGVRMGGTVTGDGGSARLADDPVPPGGFETGRLRTDLPTAPAGTNTDELRTFVSQANEFELQTGQSPTLSAANRFAGLPTDAGMHAAGGAIIERKIAPRQTDAVKAIAPKSGPATVEGRSNALERDVIAAPSGRPIGNRMAAGSHGTVGSWLAAAGGGSDAATYDQAASWEVNRWFADHAIYSPSWCATHAWAWCPAAYEAVDWTRMAWTVATRDTVAQWLAWDSQPVHSDDGFRFYHLDNSVANSSQPVASAAEPYEQANALANSSSVAQDSQDDQWLPLGVFGLVPPGQQEPAMVFQLAINQRGVIRGNSYDQASDRNLPVRGAVDERRQRAAWMVGNNNQVVVESELGHLTRDEAPALVHFGADKTSQYLMIRQRPQQEQSVPAHEGGDPLP